MAEPRSRFEDHIQSITTRAVEALADANVLDPATAGPALEAITPQLGSQAESPPEKLRSILGNAGLFGAAFETKGEYEAAFAWYRLGQFKWRGEAQFEQYIDEARPDISARAAAARNQLPAGVCADRVGDEKKAQQFYEWAALNRSLSEGELEFYSEQGNHQIIWEFLAYLAYALACLERWNEALEIAQMANEHATVDERAQSTNSYRVPVKILPIVLALSKHQVAASEETRQNVIKALDRQSASSKSHDSHLASLFHLYNLKAKHPDLANPRAEEIPPAERARRGYEMAVKWWAHLGVDADGTPESFREIENMLP